ncbi:MAG: LamG-like jellyroll fold domain-containing protein, partial [Paracoccus sp. (in: a-proteobacteria)]
MVLFLIIKNNLFMTQKKYYLLFFSFTLLLFLSQLAYAQTTFTNTPKDKQLYPRNLTTNKGTIVFSGSINGTSYNAIRVRISKNNVYSSQEDFPVSYANSKTSFNCSVSLNAELTLYKLELYGVTTNGSTTLLKSVNDILVGDAYLINGQSNAYASRINGSTTNLRSPYIVTYAGRANPLNDNWYQANGDSESGFIGQWGLKMARQIVDNYQVPVAILNEADPGTPISNFMRNEANHYNTGTNYGRLLTRAKNAGIQNNIRGIFYYQGEWDGSNATGHRNGYKKLYNNWKENYPNVEKFYVMQVREGCGSPSVELRNYQRLFQDELENLTTITSNGLTGHDGCHFYYTNGYEALGINIFRIVAMQLYGATVNPNYYSVNVEQVTMHNPNQITITTRNNNETLVWNSGAQNDFSIDNSNISITSGTVNGNKIILTLSSSIEDYSEINTITYKGHSGTGTNWIYNTEGSSLLSFYNIPVNHTFTTPSRDLGAGYALTFDGGNDYVETNLSLSSKSYTKEAWIKIDGGGSNNIISGMNNHAFWAPGGRLAAGNNGAWYTVRDSESLLPNTWYHVAVTYNSSTREMKLYKNGILVSEANNVSPANSDNYTLIGAYGRGNVFRGTIDEVKIWNTERTQEEIRAMMCAKNTNITDSSLLAYYRFDQAKSSTLVDSKGDYNGTLMNFNTSSAWVVSGAAIGDSSEYSYNSDYAVSIEGIDGSAFSIDNVLGTPKGVQIYTIDQKTYANYPNGEDNVADNLYGVFVCNPVANSATYKV